MISAGEFRNGVTFEEDGNVMQIIEFQHVKPGKGAAFVRTKVRNVITGSVVEKTYNPTAKFPQAIVDRNEMQYLYEDTGMYTLMDTETYEQIALSEEEFGDYFKFVKENELVSVQSFKGKIFGIVPPNFVTLQITKTDPGFKGNTATNTLKPAILETGAEIRVPLFINEGDSIRIDTRTGEYMERA
ncbi:MAG: elongation factor P [Clostridia bacterium]|jgi:elongation factor P|nr:elongation factor P [Clostridia bacterium]NLS84379.1 elongation factor P [Oscillospiraceae bacterium]